MSKEPLPGYPWTGKFKSLEEISEYLDADKIPCLLCGREYSKLTTHIVSGHGMDPDEYKERFGINWTCKLASRTYKEGAAKRCHKRRKEGTLLLKPPKGVTKAAIAMKKRPFNEAVRNSSRRRSVLVRYGMTRNWDDSDIKEYLRRIETGRTPSEVGQDKDMPGFAYFWTYLKKNPDFKKKFDSTWDNLPFSVQARGQQLGKRFEENLFELRRAGKTWKEIGQILGVKSGTACGHWSRMKRQGNLSPEDYTERVRWQHKDYKEYLRRVKSGRTPREVSQDDDMPSLPCFYKYRNENPAYQKKFEKIWEKLPFKVQARGSALGSRFKRDIVRLHKKGFTWKEIGQKLDINHSTAHTVWQRMKARDELQKYS